MKKVGATTIRLFISILRPLSASELLAKRLLPVCIYLAGLTLCIIPLGATIPSERTVLHYAHHGDLATLPIHMLDYRQHQETPPPVLDATLHITPFYEQQLASKEVGRFLGAAPTKTDYNIINIAPDSVVTALGADAVNNYFVHTDPTPLVPANTASVKLQFKPSYEYYGCNFSGELKLPFWSDWYVGAQLPLVDCRTNLNRQEMEAASNQPGELLNYFAGVYASEASTHRQEKVSHARFDLLTKQVSGTPQVNGWLRKELLSFPRLAIVGKASLTVPLIEPAGDGFLHAPTLGSNGHWVGGGELTGIVKILTSPTRKLDLLFTGHARYVAKAKETRIIPLATAAVAHPFGHYALLTHVTMTADEALIPAVNRLSKRIRVTPGLQYELRGSMRYQGKSLCAESGYTYLYQSSEQLGSFSWYNDTYRLAGKRYNTTQNYAAQVGTADAFVPVQLHDGSSHTFLQKSDLSLAGAGHPEREAHIVWGQLTYRLSTKFLPISFCIGLAGTVGGSSFVGHTLSAWSTLQVKI